MSIRIFFCAYDQYVSETTERPKQFVGTEGRSTTVVSPGSIKFCIDPKWLNSSITLDFIASVSSIIELYDSELRNFREEKAQESKGAKTLETLDNIVNKKLQNNMADTNGKSRIENLFVL